MKLHQLLTFLIAGILQMISAQRLEPSKKVQEAKLNEVYSVTCSFYQAPVNFHWLDPTNTTITTNEISDFFVQQTSPQSQTLIFRPLQLRFQGTYTCVGYIAGERRSESFKLHVTIPSSSQWRSLRYFVISGTNQSLYCGAVSNYRNNITWYFDQNPITGNDYQILSDRELLIKNFTKEKEGQYQCDNYVNEPGYISSNNDYMYIYVAEPPVIKPETTYEIHGTLNKTVIIWCTAKAFPSAKIKWTRDGKNVTEINPKYQVTIPNSNQNSYDAPSVLQFHLSNNRELGIYTCEATNFVNTTTRNYTIERLPVPFVRVVGFHDKSLHLSIKVNKPPANFTNYKVLYTETEITNETIWSEMYFDQDHSGKDIYIIDGLDSDTHYLLQIGACFNKKACAFNDTFSVYTTESSPVSTSSSVTIHSQIIPLIISLPLFVIGQAWPYRIV